MDSNKTSSAPQRTTTAPRSNNPGTKTSATPRSRSRSLLSRDSEVENERLFTCTGENRHLMSCVVTFFLLLVLLILLIVVCAVFSSVMSRFQFIVFLMDRQNLDIAVVLLTAFVAIGFLSILFELILWCSAHVNLCCFHMVIITRLVVIFACIGLFAGYIVCMNNLVDRDQLEKNLVFTLKNLYFGEYNTDPFSANWNAIQVEYKSCGVEGPGDYSDSSWHKHNKPFKVPLTCCKEVEQFYEATDESFSSNPAKVYKKLRVTYNVDYIKRCNNLTLQANKDTSPIKTQCSLGPVQDDLKRNLAQNGGMIALMILILIFQFLILVVTIGVCCSVKREHEDREEMRRLLYGKDKK